MICLLLSKVSFVCFLVFFVFGQGSLDDSVHPLGHSKSLSFCFPVYPRNQIFPDLRAVHSSSPFRRARRHLRNVRGLGCSGASIWVVLISETRLQALLSSEPPETGVGSFVYVSPSLTFLRNDLRLILPTSSLVETQQRELKQSR